MPEPLTDDYPYVDTVAAMMLAGGIKRLQMQGTSLRQLAKQLGYKQAVVLSHMATGRVPIPVERAADLAQALNLDVRGFTLAVLRQRFAEVDWGLVTSQPDGENELALSFTGIITEPLTPAQLRVMREVARDPGAEDRWLSVHELSAVELLRSLRPTLRTDGLGADDRRKIMEALRGER